MSMTTGRSAPSRSGRGLAWGMAPQGPAATMVGKEMSSPPAAFTLAAKTSDASSSVIPGGRGADALPGQSGFVHEFREPLLARAERVEDLEAAGRALALGLFDVAEVGPGGGG